MDEDLKHGGALDQVARHFPQAPTPWIDLSTGVSPLSYPVEPLTAEGLRDLPTRALEDEARLAAATAFGASVNNVRLLSGSSVAIATMARFTAFRSAAIVAPTYSEHARAFVAVGKPVRTVSRHDADAPEDVLILVNPNNPDGQTLPRDAVLEIARRRTHQGRWTIVDEAFADFFPEVSVVAEAGAEYTLIVLRSFGKTYGLAGIRLGAIAAPQLVLDHVEASLGPWPVSTQALQAARQAYPDVSWRTRAKVDLMARRDRLATLLDAAGVEIEGDALLFVTGRIDCAHQVWTRLCEAGIYVRRFSDDDRRLRFGLPADEASFGRLAAALKGS